MDPPFTGRLVCCDTPDALAETVIDLLDDRDARREMGARARAWVVERFDWHGLASEARHRFADHVLEGPGAEQTTDMLSR